MLDLWTPLGRHIGVSGWRLPHLNFVAMRIVGYRKSDGEIEHLDSVYDRI